MNEFASIVTPESDARRHESEQDDAGNLKHSSKSQVDGVTLHNEVAAEKTDRVTRKIVMSIRMSIREHGEHLLDGRNVHHRQCRMNVIAVDDESFTHDADDHLSKYEEESEFRPHRQSE